MPSLPRPVGVLTAVVALGALFYALAVLAMWWGQSRLVFYPSTGAYPRTPAALGLPWREISLTAADGVGLTAWYVPGPSADAPVVLLLHGNAGDIADRLETLEQLHAIGAATLILDYRGYGTSAGEPNEAGLQRDAEAAWDWLTQTQGQAGDDIVLFGRSLGGAVAARLAADRGAAGLVLESAFVSLPELARYLYPWLPAARLTQYQFDTAAALARTRCPVLIAHSPADEIVPFAHGERLTAIRPEATRLVRLSGTHNEPSLTPGSHYAATMDAFIGAVTADPAQPAPTPPQPP